VQANRPRAAELRPAASKNDRRLRRRDVEVDADRLTGASRER
jgi:hypothetical protein